MIDPTDSDGPTRGTFTARSGAYIGSVNLVAQIADRLAALVQIVVVAAAFGVSGRADIFFLAAIGPLTIGSIVGEPLGRGFMELFLRAEDRDRARQLAAAGFFASLLIAVALTAAYLVVALPVVVMAAPGGRSSLAPWLAFAPVATALALGAYLSSIVLWREHYVWAALRFPLASGASLAFVGIAVALTRDVAWIAAAISLGYAAMAVALFVAVSRALGLRWLGAATRSAFSEALSVRRRIVSPVIGGLLGGQVIVTIERVLASTLGVGAVATLSYARGISGAPSVVSEAIGAAAYPGLARAELAGSAERVRTSFLGGFRLNLLVGSAFAAYLALFGESIAAFLLQRGAFDPTSSERAGEVLVAFALGTLGSSLLRHLVAVLYAIGCFTAVFYRSLVVFATYLLLVPLLLVWLDETGLALAYSLAGFTGAIFASAYVARRLGLSAREFAHATWRIVPSVATVVGALVTYRVLVEVVHVPTEWTGVVRVFGSGVILMAVLAAAVFMRDLPESRQLQAALGRLVGRRRARYKA